MTHSETMFKNISELEKAVVQCKKCDRLVSFREKVAKEKRKSYMHWDYWGKPVPGYGNPNAKNDIRSGSSSSWRQQNWKSVYW